MEFRMMENIRGMIPQPVKRTINPVWRIFRGKPQRKRANITEPTSKLPLDRGRFTFVLAVGPSFDQNIPNAMMTLRMGYCRAFEQLGIPYIIMDFMDLERLLPSLINPFCLIMGSDYSLMSHRAIKVLKKYPHFVWVDRWFKGSNEFFASHGLDARECTNSDNERRKILDSEPSFVFTATVEQGLYFYEEWERHGLRPISLPLACDTSLYNPSAPYRPEFDGTRMAFVGGYRHNSRQLDRYLRTFEDELVIYGYNQWPYRGYRGKLSREAEPSLYRQALVCPTINEPPVKLLHGVINERGFKVLGCGGVCVADDVPAYRELFSEDELIIPKDEHEFSDIVHELLANKALRDKYSRRGYEAVMSRHTYVHRAKLVLQELGLGEDLVDGAK